MINDEFCHSHALHLVIPDARDAEECDLHFHVNFSNLNDKSVETGIYNL